MPNNNIQNTVINPNIPIRQDDIINDLGHHDPPNDLGYHDPPNTYSSDNSRQEPIIIENPENQVIINFQGIEYYSPIIKLDNWKPYLENNNSDDNQLVIQANYYYLIKQIENKIRANNDNIRMLQTRSEYKNRIDIILEIRDNINENRHLNNEGNMIDDHYRYLIDVGLLDCII